MAYAYVKLSVEPGEETEIRSALKKIPNVESADIVTGEEDIIAKVRAENPEKLLELIKTKLRKVGGIRKTVTNIVIE